MDSHRELVLQELNQLRLNGKMKRKVKLNESCRFSCSPAVISYFYLCLFACTTDVLTDIYIVSGSINKCADVEFER